MGFRGLDFGPGINAYAELIRDHYKDQAGQEAAHFKNQMMANELYLKGMGTPGYTPEVPYMGPQPGAGNVSYDQEGGATFVPHGGDYLREQQVNEYRKRAGLPTSDVSGPPPVNSVNEEMTQEPKWEEPNGRPGIGAEAKTPSQPRAVSPVDALFQEAVNANPALVHDQWFNAKYMELKQDEIKKAAMSFAERIELERIKGIARTENAGWKPQSKQDALDIKKAGPPRAARAAPRGPDAVKQLQDRINSNRSRLKELTPKGIDAIIGGSNAADKDEIRALQDQIAADTMKQNALLGGPPKKPVDKKTFDGLVVVLQKKTNKKTGKNYTAQEAKAEISDRYEVK